MIDIRLGNCLDILPSIPDASVDAVITDPPYPEMPRDYGKWSEAEWWDLMMCVCRETRRVLKPTGSAVFILQPNSNKLGSMRGWLFEFQAWVCREWNMVQDAWWWNIAAMPEAHSIQGKMMRPSLKACVWCGPSNCFRNQDNILWSESEGNRALRQSNRAANNKNPSGHHQNQKTISAAAETRGGVTPYNVIPMANTFRRGNSGDLGHGAGTPLELAKWWTRYICPPGGVVLDPFFGAGTMGLAALEYGNSIIGIEKMDKHYLSAFKRLHGDVSA